MTLPKNYRYDFDLSDMRFVTAVIYRDGRRVHEVSARTQHEAEKKAKAWIDWDAKSHGAQE